MDLIAKTRVSHAMLQVGFQLVTDTMARLVGWRYHELPPTGMGLKKT